MSEIADVDDLKNCAMGTLGTVVPVSSNNNGSVFSKQNKGSCYEIDGVFTKNVNAEYDTVITASTVNVKQKRKHRPRKRKQKPMYDPKDQSITGPDCNLLQSASCQMEPEAATAVDVSVLCNQTTSLSLSANVKSEIKSGVETKKLTKNSGEPSQTVKPRRRVKRNIQTDPVKDVNILKENNSQVLNCCMTSSDQSTSNIKVDNTNQLRHPKEDIEDAQKDKGITFSKKKSPESSSKKVKIFKKHISRSLVEKGLNDGSLIKGIIRINQRNYKEAYISSIDGSYDILISGTENRNQALEGDEVVVKLLHSSEWKPHVSGGVQKTGRVVAIYTQNHSKLAVGFLKRMTDNNSPYALFSPRDARIPRMKVPLDSCPAGFLSFPEEYENILVLIKMIQWSNVTYALGEFLNEIGPVGKLQTETAAILQENGLNVENYSEESKQYYPQGTFHISEEEIKKRIDLRGECVFTIDPSTAKDLDDAVSCKMLENGNFEVGVHISDVTYFLSPNTPLDKAVSERATSIYLVDSVHHMLPKELCLMCSLTPAEDKLAFSVFWELSPDARVISKRFTRSVVNSCVKLAYEHVQAIIENADKKWNEDDLPPISGGFKPSHIAFTVLCLHNLAVIMRAQRFKQGALRIDQTKICFSLDPTGMPSTYYSYVSTDSHRLIEEFMLLANMTVAEHLVSLFPTLAFLRCHPEPVPYLLMDLKTSLEKRGIHLDISSAGSLQASLKHYEGGDFISQARMMVIMSSCARAMSRARYFCAGMMTDMEDYKHYALNVPLYTHFTSPIRRYADVMVHRLLGASLGHHSKPKWTSKFVEKIAANCNKKKYAAKLAAEQSTKLFFTMYVKLQGPIIDDAVVVSVKDHSFDVLIISCGLVQRVYVDKMDAHVIHECEDDISVLKITWKPTMDCLYETYQVIETFTMVQVELKCSDKTFKIQAELLRPSGT